MLKFAVERTNFVQRLDTVRGIVDAAHPGGAPTATSREIRGLAILLLYAAYENLLTSLCRAILEATVQLRVGNRRLRPGLKLVAGYSSIQSIQSVSPNAIWRSGFDLVDVIEKSRGCSIDPAVFPTDGSHFRRGQVQTFCRVFGLSDPAPVLREAWQRIDTVVAERNAVAHGALSPGDVGRTYSYADIVSLIDLWQLRWCDFMDWIEATATSRDFFRFPR